MRGPFTNGLGRLAGLLLLLYGQVVFAQIDEIIVTAQKREQSIQEVGLSIAAFDEDALRESDGADISRLAAQISNIEAYRPGTMAQSFYVRGIGLNEFNGNFDSPVAVHIDEVYISKPWMISRPTFDISRVEAVKGPQGTLFGRNTTGGAVNFYTNPATDSFEAEIGARFDQYQRYQVHGFVNGPLGGDWAGRLSYYRDFGSGGPWDNLYTNDELGEPDRQMFRGQLHWAGANTSLKLLIHGGSDKSESIPYKSPGIFNLGAPGFCPEVLTGAVTLRPDSCAKFGGLAPDPAGEYEPRDIFTVNQDYWPTLNDSFRGGYVRVEHDLDFATITSITALESYDRDQREDSSADPYDATNTDWYNEMRQFTQELRLTGPSSEGWRYVAGLYFEKDELLEIDSGDLSENPLGITPPFAPRLGNNFNQDVKSIAAFFHSELSVSESLDLVGGIRFTRDTVEIDATTFLAANDPQGDEDRVTPVIPVDALIDKRDNSDVSYELGFKWTAQEDVMLYGRLSTGFRSGGYSVPFGGVITTFDPEEITAFELGLKAQTLDDKLQVNAALFRYDYDDLQINVDDPTSPLVPITRNIGTAEVWGIEADLWWVPVDNVDIKFGLGYLDAEYTKTDRTITTYAGTIALQGKRPVNTPEFTYNGLVRYERPLSNSLDLVLLGDFSWSDERYLEATAQPFDLADDYFIANARAAIKSSDNRWEVAIWGKNITDETYLTYMNNLSFFKIDIFGEPVSYGLSARLRFD